LIVRNVTIADAIFPYFCAGMDDSPRVALVKSMSKSGISGARIEEGSNTRRTGSSSDVMPG